MLFQEFDSLTYTTVGGLFVPGCVYKQRQNNHFFLSLGHRTWATIGYPLEKVQIQEQDNG